MFVHMNCSWYYFGRDIKRYLFILNRDPTANQNKVSTKVQFGEPIKFTKIN